ncbi:hypothetical protein CRG98_036962 [Punica granatum]|uniref:Uncharacterized protein n=1 Tax=Punica granatum TaxID=22663 RepID=A0A2I0IG57_PUNGR|nr:hypothetical protein CRG98_036962 [Punica granatum]
MAGVAASHAVLTLSSLRKIGTFSSIRIAAEIRVLGRACCQYTPSLTEAYEDLFCINGQVLSSQKVGYTWEGGDAYTFVPEKSNFLKEEERQLRRNPRFSFSDSGMTSSSDKGHACWRLYNLIFGRANPVQGMLTRGRRGRWAK